MIEKMTSRMKLCRIQVFIIPKVLGTNNIPCKTFIPWPHSHMIKESETFKTFLSPPSASKSPQASTSPPLHCNYLHRLLPLTSPMHLITPCYLLHLCSSKYWGYFCTFLDPIWQIHLFANPHHNISVAFVPMMRCSNSFWLKMY